MNDLNLKAALDASEPVDYIIVGGGSAGCVVAARLSEDPNVSVVLMEAGDDFEPGTEPALSRDARTRAFFAHEFFWPGLLAEVNRPTLQTQAPRVLPIQQARVMGGGSAINGMHAQRGLERDYREWEAIGISGWGPDDVMPFFKRLETDVDFENSDHGSGGPIRIQRVPERDWSALSHATRSALERRGLPRIADLNSAQGDGCGAVPLNISPQERVSTARAYLTGDVRRRRNVRIVAKTSVTRLIFDGTRVVAVDYDGAHGRGTLRGRNTVVCCGGIHSPALLLRSGIGPGSQLQELGITVVADRAGVGENLLNHPLISLSAHLRRRARRSRPGVLPPCTFVARFSSAVKGCPPTDLVLDVWERVPGPLQWDPLLAQFTDFMLLLNKPFSTGHVTLNREELSGPPVVKFNLLSDPRDRERVAVGFEFISQIVRDPSVRPLMNELFLIRPSPAMFRVLRNTWGATAFSAAASLALDGPAALRRRLLRDTTIPIDDVLEDRRAIRELVQDHIMPGGHPAGTCRMGRIDDTQAVTDSRCRVIGVHGLRVVDASIFPTLMTAGTNLPAIMAGERASALMIEDRQRAQVSEAVTSQSAAR